ncbi:MAG TPA: hypothetical protein PLU23_08785, partial [Anaerolineaceae bacterium]|nr:hypothetical protein [Anaerolineaceae bacterium]
CGPCDFQSHALPTELTRRGSSILIADGGTVKQKGFFDIAICCKFTLQIGSDRNVFETNQDAFHLKISKD